MGFWTVSDEPSPNSQSHELIKPDGEVDKSEKEVKRPAQLPEKAKAGTGCGLTKMDMVVSCMHPLALVTERETI